MNCLLTPVMTLVMARRGYTIFNWPIEKFICSYMPTCSLYKWTHPINCRDHPDYDPDPWSELRSLISAEVFSLRLTFNISTFKSPTCVIIVFTDLRLAHNFKPVQLLHVFLTFNFLGREHVYLKPEYLNVPLWCNRKNNGNEKKWEDRMVLPIMFDVTRVINIRSRGRPSTAALYSNLLYL